MDVSKICNQLVLQAISWQLINKNIKEFPVLFMHQI